MVTPQGKHIHIPCFLSILSRTQRAFKTVTKALTARVWY